MEGVIGGHHQQCYIYIYFIAIIIYSANLIPQLICILYKQRLLGIHCICIWGWFCRLIVSKCTYTIRGQELSNIFQQCTELQFRKISFRCILFWFKSVGNILLIDFFRSPTLIWPRYNVCFTVCIVTPPVVHFIFVKMERDRSPFLCVKSFKCRNF